jgi:hypothetical protein
VILSTEKNTNGGNELNDSNFNTKFQTKKESTSLKEQSNRYKKSEPRNTSQKNSSCTQKYTNYPWMKSLQTKETFRRYQLQRRKDLIINQGTVSSK